MEPVLRRCCGLDVHQKTVVACRRILDEEDHLQQEVRTFGTMTAELLAMSDWLAEAEVTHVAMESTGVFWKPIWNLLEDRFQILLVNARHIKQVPGRKTDVKDCEWIAQLLQHGLLKASFVPDRPQRELRDLTRHRAKLVGEKSSVVNRIHKTLEDANIKLGSVASDILGVSGRDMLAAMAGGEDDPEKLAELARRRMRGKIPVLCLALEGRVTEHHRFMLATLLDHLHFLEKQIARLDKRIDRVLPSPFEAAVALLVSIPGVQKRSAENIVAEIGSDLHSFPSADHLASWAGVCPGNNESAGKRRSGKTAKGNRWLQRALTEVSWAAARTKDTYLAAQYRRLASRRGKKRAIVALNHTIIVACYHMLTGHVAYQDLGPDYLDHLDPQRLTRYLVRRLEKLGHQVTLQPLSEAA